MISSIRPDLLNDSPSSWLSTLASASFLSSYGFSDSDLYSLVSNATLVQNFHWKISINGVVFHKWRLLDWCRLRGFVDLSNHPDLFS